MNIMKTRKAASFLLAVLLIVNLPAIMPLSATADVVTRGLSIELGGVRVQILSETLVRVEAKGPNGFEDRPTYHIVGRDWPGTDSTTIPGADSTRIVTKNYTVSIPNNAASLTGVAITDPNGEEIWSYTSLPSSSVYLPDPGSTPKAWAIADNPRVVPADWGYNPMPESATAFPDYNGWDVSNNAPDMYVFVSGQNARQLREDFIKLTGSTEMMPLKALGYWYSRYYPYGEANTLERIDEFREAGFPIDNFVVDTDWRINASIGYDINTTLFPDMERFFNRAHEKNVSIMFNDHPEPQSGQHALSAVDLNYRNNNLRKLLGMGLDTWWFDRNWTTTIISPFAGIPKESFGMYLYQWITKDNAPNKRPLIMGNVDGIDNGVFNRAPNLASHRFSLQWTGDTTSGPEEFKQEVINAVRTGAVASLPYVSTDVGGHIGTLSNAAWARWTQFAALSPIIRHHGSNGANSPDRAPFAYGAGADVGRDYIKMRYRLLPLFYALSHENYLTGLPLTRRLDYNYPGYPESQDNTEYTLGDGILVAPMCEWDNPTAVPNSWLTTIDGQPGLFAQYYNGRSTVNMNTATPVLERVEKNINYNWGAKSPAAEIATDNFLARWIGYITIGQDCRLAASVDDGVRLYIGDGFNADGSLINQRTLINSWRGQNITTFFTTDTFKAGEKYAMRLEYYEGTGEACIRFQYAPLVSGDNTRTVFIPDGRWIDAWSGAEYTGPQTITVSHGIETSPIFVRSGTIIPLAEDMLYIGEKSWNKIALDVYPSTKLKGVSELYEDDEISVGYKTGEYRTTALETSYDSGEVVVKIGAAQGSFAGSDKFSQREWNVRVHAPAGWGSLDGVKLNGSDAAAITAKISKVTGAVPFSTSGGSRDSDVYEIKFAANLNTASELRVKFATPQDEVLPAVSSGVEVNYNVLEKQVGNVVDLTGLGSFDWVYYGNGGNFVKKAGANGLIGSVNTSHAEITSLNFPITGFSWTDGAPVSSARNARSGIAFDSGDVSFDVKVGPNEKSISVFLGGYMSEGSLQITDDAQKQVKVIDISNVGGSHGKHVVVTAKAEKETTLHFRYVKNSESGYASLMAVAVSDVLKRSDMRVSRSAQLEVIPDLDDLNMSDPKYIDWVHLGADSTGELNRKAGVDLLPEPVFEGSANRMSDYRMRASWNDGTPKATMTNSRGGSYTVGAITVLAPATNMWRELKLYLGCYNSTNNIEIYDDTGEASTLLSFSAGTTSINQCLTIRYRSEVDANLTIVMTNVSSAGNVSLMGYTLSEESPILSIKVHDSARILAAGFKSNIPVDVVVQDGVDKPVYAVLFDENYKEIASAEVVSGKAVIKTDKLSSTGADAIYSVRARIGDGAPSNFADKIRLVDPIRLGLFGANVISGEKDNAKYISQIKFGGRIRLDDNASIKLISGNNETVIPLTAVTVNNDSIIFADTSGYGETIIVSGLRYVEYFPDYSFTFTLKLP